MPTNKKAKANFIAHAASRIAAAQYGQMKCWERDHSDDDFDCSKINAWCIQNATEIWELAHAHLRTSDADET